MKKIYYGLLFSLLMIIVGPLTPVNGSDNIVHAASVTVNSTNFPDENFRKYISENCDTDSNGILSDSEIAATTTINVSNKGIADLTGVGYFTEIWYLNCTMNDLTALNVDRNTKLKYLQCYMNNISSLDVSKNTLLLSLNCHSNNLTALSLSKNTSLTELICGNNKISRLDITMLTKLEVIYCQENKISSLDISKNTVLKELHCGSNCFACYDLNNAPSTLTKIDFKSQSIDYHSDDRTIRLSDIGSGIIESKISNLSGAELSQGVLINITSSTITYDYDLGYNGTTMPVTINVTFDTYTITYYANGGSGAPDSQIKMNGIDLKLSSIEPVRTGYTFVGWGKSSSTKTISYEAGSTYSQDEDINLYAIWFINLEVTYNANGGSGAPSGHIAMIYEQSLPYSYTISDIVPTRNGYDFLGWATSSDATSESYHSGQTIFLSSNTTLYAVWSSRFKEYTVTYNANGGSGIPASQKKTEGTALKLSSTVPSRSGYTFMGWGTSGSTTTVSYEPGANYSQDANITLYAIWQKPVTLTMHPNGGMIGNGYQTSITKYLYNAETGKIFTVSTAVEPSREGYDFVGWNADSVAKTASYQKGDTISLSSDKTLYAIWKKGVTLTYDGNGGDGAPSAVTGYLYNTETSYTFTISNTKPERSGYAFLGWSREENADNASYKVADPVSITSNTTLYAVWEVIPAATYTVTYNANGGSGAPASQTKTDGVDLTLSTVTPKRDGYTFAGWGIASSSTTASYSAGGSYTKNANLTLYAIWKKTLTLAYNANGGSGAPASQNKTIYNDVSEYTFTISNVEPFWEGHSFTGWGTSADATSTYGSGEDITVSNNTTLYAIWSVIPTDEKVTLTYSNINGGENIPAPRTVDKGSIVNLSGLHPTKEGYEFLGWSKDQYATSASYAPSDTVDLYSDLTLYAIWKKTITLSYHANGGSGQPETVSKPIYNTATRATFSIDKQTPDRDNYIFLGWNNDDNATSAAYAPGDAIDLSSNLTLYAVWKIKPEGGNTPGEEPTTEEPKDSETKPAVKSNQTITASNKTVAIKSNPVKLGAKTNGNGKLTYVSSAKSVATISATGVVTPRNYGETTITISAAATSTFKAATKKIKIYVVPKKMVLKSAKPVSNRGILLKWNKDKTSSGYEAQICLRKDFKSGAYQRFYKVSTVRKKITNLKKKTWYVRIRAYKKIGKKTYNGIWSNVRKAKVK